MARTICLRAFAQLRAWGRAYLETYVNALSPNSGGRELPRRFVLAMFSSGIVLILGALATAPFLPGATHDQRRLFVNLLMSSWLPWGIVQFVILKRVKSQRSRVLASVTGELAVAFVIQLLVPPARGVVLMYYVLVVGYYAYPGGVVAGLVGAAEAVAYAWVASAFAPVAQRLHGVELVMLGAGALAVAILVDMIGREQRLAVDRLLELERLKNDFLAGASHEVRTPLTAIEGFTDTLVERWHELKEPARIDMLLRISRNSVELRRLIDQLLNFSKVDDPTTCLDRVVLPLRPAVEACVDAHAYALRSHDVVVVIEDDLAARADRDAFERVLGNLLTNAAKYSRAGSTIRVAGHMADGIVTIEVADKGVGIAVEEQSKIFDRFYQAGHRGPGREGTGMGLAIAARYAALLDGSLSVSSRPGFGSTFAFTLQARPLVELAPRFRRPQRATARSASPARRTIAASR